jgi:large subunit ribosomal protein L3
MVRGSVPGAKDGYVMVRDAIKRKRPEGVPYPAAFLEPQAPLAPQAPLEPQAMGAEA